jgi:hypothetical protein
MMKQCTLIPRLTYQTRYIVLPIGKDKKHRYIGTLYPRRHIKSIPRPNLGAKVMRPFLKPFKETIGIRPFLKPFRETIGIGNVTVGQESQEKSGDRSKQNSHNLFSNISNLKLGAAQITAIKCYMLPMRAPNFNLNFNAKLYHKLMFIPFNYWGLHGLGLML